jgi:hypothetical protein
MRIYMCGVDYQHEMDVDIHYSALPEYFMSVEDLKVARTCWKQCGIVELELTPVSWPEKQDLFGHD